MYQQRSMAEIDLASRSVMVRAIPYDVRRQLLGGRGINARILCGLLRQTTDFLPSESILVLGAGLLTGTPAPHAARVHLAGKYRRSGDPASAMLSGHFGAEMRFAGYDHLIISGRSHTPVYLLVHDGNVEFRDAGELPDEDASEMLLAIREELDDEDVQIICTGKEREKRSESTAVATGTGLKTDGSFSAVELVMGAKNLRAIAARGTLPLEIYDPEKALSCLKMVMDLAAGRKTDGTDCLPDDLDERAALMFHRECLAAAGDAMGIEPRLLVAEKEMLEPYLELIHAVSGLEFSAREIVEVGERIIDLENLLCLSEASEPAMPPDALTAAFPPCGPAPEVAQRFLEVYNRIRGWSPEGRPSQETLIRLGLNPDMMDPL
jgi:aldehyde:ferredoxin oxidoreductase